MKSGSPLKKYSGPDHYDCIVIGSGIGGLAAAAILAKRGKKVLVLEKHYTPGGFTHVFKRRDYEWDVGIHYIGEVNHPLSPTRKLFDYITNGDLKWAQMQDVYDRIIFPDRSYDFVTGRKAWLEKIKSYFPGEEAAIDRYNALLKEVTDGASKMFFAERALPGIIRPFLAPLMRRKLLKISDKTVREVLDGITDNSKLKAVLCGQFGDYGLQPSRASFAIHAMVASHYFQGANYPVGGSGRIADTIIPVIENAGGKVLISAGVEEILVEGGRAKGVKMETGETFSAPLIISDAGFVNTMGNLLKGKVPGYSRIQQQLQQVKASISHVCLYIGLKFTAKELGLEQTNLWVYPGYDHDTQIGQFIADPQASLPLVYISFPSTKDPEWESRYPGRSTIEVITLAPYSWFEKWENDRWHHRGEEYEAFKGSLSQRLLEVLYLQVPQVKGKIETYELSTPVSTRHFANYPSGEIYGLEHSPERFRMKFLGPRTPVKGLYLTGQDVVTAGVAGALYGAVVCASAIVKRNVLTGL